jgi:hydroxypyruvate reductase
MSPAASDLRADALRIWMAGLEAVRSERLMREAVRIEGRTLVLGNDFRGLPDDALRIDLSTVRRIAVVGAGKAGAGMAAALEEILGQPRMDEKQLIGWINVPADCVRELQRIHLHAARPAGVNEPTEAGVAGTNEILRMVGSLGPDDLCIALISGGGSALMPAPIEGISLADKVAVTRFLSAAGANIAELNTVRKQLSRIKGGGLARACQAGRLVTLIISDIPGDPLDLIASGPTVPDQSTPQEALKILEQFGGREAGVPAVVLDVLTHKPEGEHRAPPICQVNNIIIGNNATAVMAAGKEAERLGYEVETILDTERDLTAEQVGVRLLEKIGGRGKHCIVEGGECVVKLAPQQERGLGGRNQQTVLAALAELRKHDSIDENRREILILSAGTDGEDGPTDAAGAFVDWQVIEEAERRGMNRGDFLRRNDAYHFFEPLGALVKTGPTNTNVCDVRVVVAERRK